MNELATHHRVGQECNRGRIDDRRNVVVDVVVVVVVVVVVAYWLGADIHSLSAADNQRQQHASEDLGCCCSAHSLNCVCRALT